MVMASYLFVHEKTPVCEPVLTDPLLTYLLSYLLKRVIKTRENTLMFSVSYHPLPPALNSKTTPTACCIIYLENSVFRNTAALTCHIQQALRPEYICFRIWSHAIVVCERWREKGKSERQS